MDAQEMLDRADDTMRWTTVRKLHQAVADARERQAVAVGEARRAKKEVNDCENKLKAFLEEQMRPCPLFDQPTERPQLLPPGQMAVQFGNGPWEVREQPPLKAPTLAACDTGTVSADDEEDRRAAELAQPSQGPARDFERWVREVRDPADKAFQADPKARRFKAGKDRAELLMVRIPCGAVAAKWSFSHGGGCGSRPWGIWPSEERAAEDFLSEMAWTGIADVAAVLAMPLLPWPEPAAEKKTRPKKPAPASVLPGIPQESAAERAAKILGPSLSQQAADRKMAREDREEGFPGVTEKPRLVDTLIGSDLPTWVVQAWAVLGVSTLDGMAAWFAENGADASLKQSREKRKKMFDASVKEWRRARGTPPPWLPQEGQG